MRNEGLRVLSARARSAPKNETKTRKETTHEGRERYFVTPGEIELLG